MDDLFGTQERQARALARTENPKTSKDAAKKMVKSGELSRQENEVLDTIKKRVFKDFTTKDVAVYMQHKYSWHKANDICKRRFSGLRDKGKIKTTGGRRDGCQIWRLL